MIDLENSSKKIKCLVLFWEFFKVSSFVLGGGFAILLVADDIFAKKYKILRDGELDDMLAIIQTVPGLTAGNVAIYAGYRVAGTWGAIMALLGVATPSFLIITLVSIYFKYVPMENTYIQGAFIGVRTAMLGLTVVAMVRFWKSSVTCKGQFILFFVTLFAMLCLRISPSWVILSGIIFGLAHYFKNYKKMKVLKL